MVSDHGHETLKELKDHCLAAKLELRIGTVVALVTNLDIDAGLCNGSQGRVVAFQKHDPQMVESIKKKAGPMKADRIEDFIVAQLDAYGKLEYPVVECDAAHGRPSTNRIIYPDCLMTDKRNSQSHHILSRTQVPLI
jgi:ATP-dependent DNA helicase PIF1